MAASDPATGVPPAWIARLLYGPAGIVLSVAAALALHLALIGADTPSDLGPIRLDSGAYCDEGYKTYDARNLLLFGDVRWTPADEYGGNWTEGSPVNTWLTWLTFRLVGVDLAAARILNLLFAAGSCVVFWRLLGRRFGPAAAFWGSLLLAVHPLFFVYGRLALLESKLLFFCLLALLMLPERPSANLATAVRVLAGGAALTAAFGTKETAMVFAGALAAGLVAYGVTRLVRPLAALRWLTAAVALGCLVAVVVVELRCQDASACGSLHGRALVAPILALRGALVADLLLLNPALAALGVLGTLCVTRRALAGRTERPLDLVFVAWFLIPTLFFSSFQYRPDRYYLLAVPPLIWLGVMGLAELRSSESRLLGRGAGPWAIALLAPALFVGLVNAAPLLLADVQIGGGRGLLRTTLVGPVYGPPVALIAVLAAIALWLVARRAGSATTRALPSAVLAILALSTAIGALPLARWAARPPYQLDEAAAAIRGLGEDVVLVGDWAPQLGFPAGVRTIYSTWNAGMGHSLNVDNLERVGATHVALVETINDGYRRRLDELYPGALHSEPALRFRYGGREVTVHEFDPGREARR